MVTSAPSRSRARKCVSTRRRPMTSPPGGGRLTRPKRASIGPARRIEARMRAHSTGSSSRGSARAVFTSTAFGPSQRTSAPRCASNASIVSATRLPPVRWRHATSFDLVLTAGGPLVVLGLVLGPGIDLINRSVLAALAPVTALAIGWIGAALGARFEWRYVRRIGRGTWLLAALSAVAAFAVVALGAWLLTRVVPSLSAAWTPRLPALLTLGAVAAASGPGAVTLVARAVGVRKSVTRAFSVAAALETAGGALAFTLPLALHRAHPLGGHVAVGWLAWLVFAGALLTLPTPWVLIAVPLLVAARAAAKWVAVRSGSVALSLVGAPPRAGLGTIAQGGAAIAMGLNFFITYGGEATGPSGALLTTIVLGVAVAQLAAPPLMALALRTTVASPVAPAPLTPAAAPAELSANATADWPR